MVLRSLVIYIGLIIPSFSQRIADFDSCSSSDVLKDMKEQISELRHLNRKQAETIQELMSRIQVIENKVSIQVPFPSGPSSTTVDTSDVCPTTTTPPGNVDLYIHEDFVEVFPRLGYEHKCSVRAGGVGRLCVELQFPMGSSTKYEILSGMGTYDSHLNFTRVSIGNGDEMFIMKETNSSDGCTTHQEIRFLLNITKDWENGTITCGYRDSRLQNYFSQTEIIKPIPRFYCDGYSDGDIREHPDGCHRYVECAEIDGAMYPYGESCGTQKCIDFNTKTCMDCTSVNCLDIITTTTTTAPTESTMTTMDPNAILGVECNGTSVELGTKDVKLNCLIKVDDFTQINISRTRTDTAVKQYVAFIASDGTVHLNDTNTFSVESNFVGTIKTFTLVLLEAKCSTHGTYTVKVSQSSSEKVVLPEDFVVNILAQPSQPTIEIDPTTVENSTNPIHKCKGNVGNPPGDFYIEIQERGSTEFKEYSQYYVTPTPTTVQEECSTFKTLSFGLKLPLSFNYSTIRCRAENSVSVRSNEVFASKNETIGIIPENYCTTVVNSYLPHPLGCNHYVICVNGIVYGKRTATTDTCFDFSLNSTNWCRDITGMEHCV